MINTLKLKTSLQPIFIVLTYTWYAHVINFLAQISNTSLALYNLYTVKHHPTSVAIRNEQDLFQLSLLIVATAVLHPLYEELAFRLVLKPKSKNALVLGTSSLIAFCIIHTTGLHKFLSTFTQFGFTIPFVILTLILFLISLSIFSKPSAYNALKVISEKKWLIYLTSGLFALFHINVIGIPQYFWLYIPLLLPYFLTGLLFVQLRFNHGFIYAFLVHGLFNLSLTVINLSTR